MKYDEAKQLYKFDVYEEIPANGFCFVLAQSKTTGDACLYKKAGAEMKELMHSTSDPGNLLGLVKENDTAAYVVTDSNQKVFGLNLNTSDIVPLFAKKEF